MSATGEADLHFYFDPVCPFAWMTSKWVRMVAAQRDYRVDWRFISLRMLNAAHRLRAHFPPEYEAGHTAGLRLLRVAARVRAEHGRDAVGAALRSARHRASSTPPATSTRCRRRTRAARHVLEPLLGSAACPPSWPTRSTTTGLDAEIRAETDEALALTGRDVGTPILHFQPPGGTAFFGPVISRLPSDADAVELWDHVVGLASFPGFAELKRSLRERPQLASFGVEAESVGMEEDWHGGSRRTKK